MPADQYISVSDFENPFQPHDSSELDALTLARALLMRGIFTEVTPCGKVILSDNIATRDDYHHENDAKFAERFLPSAILD
ncbi:hypothetical protein [Sphaerotilus sp.]|uniref:hypothetical protein n=1 Tax=Sphaerotilus sp. TaxID=2093942 RepID=UPI002ACE3571|nr:hypothetical protein [Sphaerotilus sp.]MDZ7855079.1 hypothetical protein [Sphaerotilus sp.]